jgi:hypothetical protein
LFSGTRRTKRLSDGKQTEGQVEEYVLTDEDFRKLILDKLERARQLSQVEANRELDEFA